MQFVVALMHVVRLAREPHRRIRHGRVAFIAENFGDGLAEAGTPMSSTVLVRG
jgi:hypothetical protein